MYNNLILKNENILTRPLQEIVFALHLCHLFLPNSSSHPKEKLFQSNTAIATSKS